MAARVALAGAAVRLPSSWQLLARDYELGARRVKRRCARARTHTIQRHGGPVSAALTHPVVLSSHRCGRLLWPVCRRGGQTGYPGGWCHRWPAMEALKTVEPVPPSQAEPAPQRCWHRFLAVPPRGCSPPPAAFYHSTPAGCGTRDTSPCGRCPRAVRPLLCKSFAPASCDECRRPPLRVIGAPRTLSTGYYYSQSWRYRLRYPHPSTRCHRCRDIFSPGV